MNNTTLLSMFAYGLSGFFVTATAWFLGNKKWSCHLSHVTQLFAILHGIALFERAVETYFFAQLLIPNAFLLGTLFFASLSAFIEIIIKSHKDYQRRVDEQRLVAPYSVGDPCK